MTWKQMEAWKERRLWLGQVIVPAAAILMMPEVRAGIAARAHNAKEYLKSKFQKKES